MYSPRIRDELIPRLYLIAKARGVRMTALVNGIIEKALHEMEDTTNKEVMPNIRVMPKGGD